MQVTAHVRAFYDWVPLPPDVKVTDEDIKSGRVMPGSLSGTWRAKVERQVPSHNLSCISERELIAWIVHRAMPQQGRWLLSRQRAMADYLATRLYPNQLHPSQHVTHFEVHDDGPDPALFDQVLAEYEQATTVHGEPLIGIADLAKLRELYLETKTHAEHVDHLHDRFNVAKPKKVA